MFTVDQVVSEHYPALNRRKYTGPLIKGILRRMLHEQAFSDFSEAYPHLQGIEFVEQVLNHFRFSFAVTDHQRENVPASGRVMIIANHPIGSLDGLALLKLVYDIRSDVRIVANDLLTTISPLRSLLLPVRNMNGKAHKEQIKKIGSALAKQQAVIMFPAGEVSRAGVSGIKDREWRRGFLKIAESAKAPILPIYIAGRNRASFYLTSSIAKPLSTLMLVGEIFHQQDRQLKMTIGSLVPYEAYSGINIRPRDKVRLFRKHLYRIGRGKKPLFATTSAIARPERKTDLKKAISNGEMLGRTPDGKTIYLFAPVDSSPVMREIGRLRELTFRAVGEGTGNRRDLDHFDWYYRHIILWDEDDLEIAGAYRFADAGKIVHARGPAALYSTSLFNLREDQSYFLHKGLELGRSFVQQRYWGRRSLDYLWYGIGAFLKKNPQFRYLFGPVSISNTIPRMARELLIFFYTLYFSGENHGGCSRNPFRFSIKEEKLAAEFTGEDYPADFKRLKSLLSNLGTSVPPLYKQYTELCEPGGAVFLDFNIDPAFNNCIDGLVIVDTTRLKAKKRRRYIDDTVLR